MNSLIVVFCVSCCPQMMIQVEVATLKFKDMRTIKQIHNNCTKSFLNTKLVSKKFYFLPELDKSGVESLTEGLASCLEVINDGCFQIRRCRWRHKLQFETRVEVFDRPVDRVLQCVARRLVKERPKGLKQSLLLQHPLVLFEPNDSCVNDAKVLAQGELIPSPHVHAIKQPGEDENLGPHQLKV